MFVFVGEHYRSLYVDLAGRYVFSNEEAEIHKNAFKKTGVDYELWQVNRIVDP